MGIQRLFTASVLSIAFFACGGEETLPDQSSPRASTPPPVVIKDASIEEQLYGTWSLSQMNGERLSEEHDLFGLRQTYLADHNWLIGFEQEEDSSIVGGGRWSYDANTGQINNMFLPDSTAETLILIDINDRKMEIETPSGKRQTWSRIAELPDSLKVAP